MADVEFIGQQVMSFFIGPSSDVQFTTLISGAPVFTDKVTSVAREAMTVLGS